MRSFVSFSALALALAAQASLVTIDDFSTLPQSVSSNVTGVNAAKYGTDAGIFGGSRAIIVQDVVTTFGRAAQFDVDGGAFGSHGLGAKSRGVAVYGATGIVGPTNNAWFVSGNNNLSLSGLTGWEFEWLGSDRAVNLTVAARTFDGFSYAEKRWQLAVPAGGPSTLMLGAGNVLFDNGLDPAAIDHLFFVVDSTSTATDWGMTKFSAVVPEPASMAVLGIGLAALRRRRKN